MPVVVPLGSAGAMGVPYSTELYGGYSIRLSAFSLASLALGYLAAEVTNSRGRRIPQGEHKHQSTVHLEASEPRRVPSRKRTFSLRSNSDARHVTLMTKQSSSSEWSRVTAIKGSVALIGCRQGDGASLR